MTKLLGIDVGIIHLALVSASTTVDDSDVQVSAVRLIDVTKITCHPGCTLRHSNNIVDRMAHLFEAYVEVFDEADEILVERQPLGGLVHVEALLYSRFRHKARMVSPNAMHHHFGLPRGEYEARKAATVRVAAPYLLAFRDELALMPRLHDVADAVCLCLYVTQDSHRRRAAAEEAEQAAEERQHKLELLRAHDNPLNPFSKFALPTMGGCFAKPKLKIANEHPELADPPGRPLRIHSPRFTTRRPTT